MKQNTPETTLAEATKTATGPSYYYLVVGMSESSFAMEGIKQDAGAGSGEPEKADRTAGSDNPDAWTDHGTRVIQAGTNGDEPWDPPSFATLRFASFEEYRAWEKGEAPEGGRLSRAEFLSRFTWVTSFRMRGGDAP